MTKHRKTAPQVRRFSTLCVFLFALMVMAGQAHAACSSPAGSAGDMIYNDDLNVLQFCDGTNWQGVNGGASGSGGCTDPSRYEGAIVYHSDYNVPQLCSGSVWVALGKMNSGASGGGCTNPTGDEGEIVYNTDEALMQYCDGSAWKRLYGGGSEPDCPVIGDTCADGSVYAGDSPATGEKMFVARCDIGMSWDGTSCSGTRDSHPWNDGNSNFVNTSVPNCGDAVGCDPDGEANTGILVTTDSNDGASGDQPHVAAEDCDGLSVHGKEDWYLPSAPELDVIYENLVDGTPDDDSPDPLITGFSTGSYWSSSENSYREGWHISFSNGSVGTPYKRDNYAVRCARQ